MLHRWRKVEKVGVLSIATGGGVWGHAPPRKFLKNTARRLNLGAFEAKNSIILTILSNE